MRQALGISVHTGWGAWVVVGGSLAKPEIVANEIVDVLDDSERFCFHMAAAMKRSEAEKFLNDVKKRAHARAKQAFARLAAKPVAVCAVVAKPGEPGALDEVLASHARLHSAEGFFYRDVFREACSVPVRVVPPASLDVSKVGKLSPPPWGKDQKLAAVAAFQLLRG
jgi:hypothetical protein